MTHYLTLSDKKTWENLSKDWQPSECKTYAYGPNGEFADIIGPNYFEKEDGTREPRPGFLVNIAGELPAAMAEYALAEPPVSPKRVFA
jgi:hypothetical protein